MTQELTSNRILMDIRFETGNDLTLEEVLFVQNSFHSNWRVKALDQLQFDEDDLSDDSQLELFISAIPWSSIFYRDSSRRCSNFKTL